MGIIQRAEEAVNHVIYEVEEAAKEVVDAVFGEDQSGAAPSSTEPTADANAAPKEDSDGPATGPRTENDKAN